MFNYALGDRLNKPALAQQSNIAIHHFNYLLARVVVKAKKL